MVFAIIGEEIYKKEKGLIKLSDKDIVFMGTSEFSVRILLALTGSQYNIKMVYTRQDSTGGRGRKTLISPVKKAALENSLPVRQPASLKLKEEQSYLQDLKPDIVIVAAYGLILPVEVLSLPPFGCINVHPSLLPGRRGPSPIPAAILAGDFETGVSIMLMDEGVDTGPVLKQRSISVEAEDTTETLARKLAELGASLLLDVLPGWFEGKIKPVSQDNRLATYSKVIRKEEGEIAWQSSTAVEIWLKVRAFNPWPGCYSRWKGKLLKILKAKAMRFTPAIAVEPGKVLEIAPVGSPGKKAIAVGTREGVLELEVVQYEGGRAMAAEEFARGRRDFVGSVLT